MATSESIDAQKIILVLENLMNQPLEKFFRDYRVRYVAR